MGRYTCPSKQRKSHQIQLYKNYHDKVVLLTSNSESTNSSNGDTILVMDLYLRDNFWYVNIPLPILSLLICRNRSSSQRRKKTWNGQLPCKKTTRLSYKITLGIWFLIFQFKVSLVASQSIASSGNLTAWSIIIKLD